jgi:hypothetical protein
MSKTRTQVSKAAALASVQALIAGTQKHFPKGSLNFGNATYTSASLLQLLESLAEAITGLNAAQLAAKDALTNKLDVEAKVGPVITAYKSFVKATFTGASQTLADFGLEPPKARTPLSTEQKAVAVAKAAATRQARGTKGKKAKLSVKGNVIGVNVIPVTEPPAAPPPEPAPEPAPLAPTAPSAAAAPAAPATK